MLSTIEVGASKATTLIVPVWPACCTPLRGAERREQVGAEHALEVGVAGEHRLQLARRLVGVVVVELGFQHLDLREALGHLRLEAFLALVGGRDAGLDVRDVDLALAADRLGERAGGHLAAEHVVGSDVGEREVGVAGAGLVLAGADEGVDGDHRNAGVMRLAQRLDQLRRVGRRDQDRVGLARRSPRRAPAPAAPG